MCSHLNYWYTGGSQNTQSYKLLLSWTYHFAQAEFLSIFLPSCCSIWILYFYRCEILGEPSSLAFKVIQKHPYSFLCALNSSLFQPLNSPKMLMDLALGAHSIKVISLLGCLFSPNFLYDLAMFSNPPSAPWKISNHFLNSSYLINKSLVTGYNHWSSNAHFGIPYMFYMCPKGSSGY